MLCNGCYGYLLRLYEIKAGTEPDDVKAELLADQLGEIVALAAARDIVRKGSYPRDPEQVLTDDSLRFLASAERSAGGLEEDTPEWSGPIIYLCKLVERELVERFLRPLQASCTPEDLADELDDPDLASLARWCAGKAKPPELGKLRHALITVARSKRRAETSAVIRAVTQQAGLWSLGGWLLDANGLPSLLSDLTNRYRNDAAHLGVIGPADYQRCRTLVIGNDGLVWQLIDATQ
jgi:hypothetical protein